MPAVTNRDGRKKKRSGTKRGQTSGQQREEKKGGGAPKEAGEAGVDTAGAEESLTDNADIAREHPAPGEGAAVDCSDIAGAVMSEGSGEAHCDEAVGGGDVGGGGLEGRSGEVRRKNSVLHARAGSSVGRVGSNENKRKGKDRVGGSKRERTKDKQVESSTFACIRCDTLWWGGGSDMGSGNES